MWKGSQRRSKGTAMRPTWKWKCPTRLRSRISAVRPSALLAVAASLGGPRTHRASLPALSLIFGARADDMGAAQTAGTLQPHSVRTLSHLNGAERASRRRPRAIEDGRWRHALGAGLQPRRTPRSPGTADAALAGLDRAIRLEPKNADHFLARGLALSQVARVRIAPFAISIRRSRSIREMPRR